MTDAKTKIRKGSLYNRRMLDRNVYDARTAAVTQRAISYLLAHQAKCVHLFLPIARNNEFDTWPLLKHLVSEGIKVVVSATDFERETMNHFIYTDDLVFEEDRFAIPTPKSGRTANVMEIDTVLIPLLAADKKGNRIGYGKGYYDRLLAEMSPEVLKIGVSLSPPFDEFPFVESHDVAMDVLVTPYETIETRKQ
ncbi:5-formyltetrahydrofolate cyclo-ligase [Marinoscillum furvescens]|uniref:5-formyltetrahydrofolate cyclo-ligase n=1 Tax=Marinoscillum furvescens DSM 4134 TaxID=1122208 RepID=A0A3D9L4L0_MARFU|nr:5-formyltetrahydrofolate cyclo-ligase [Marinoscillum furvescens]RED98877.1 5-formyltetrahydrofolate cyclo-ligase [Marinoscillum furvescens DSM 4134]